MTSRSCLRVVSALAIVLLLHGMQSAAHADVYWIGAASNDWANPANWSNGFPSDVGAGSTILNPGSPNLAPLVSTSGNTTTGQIYVSIGAGLNVASGGTLTTSDLLTGQFGNSGGTIVTGGQMNMSGLLNLGNGGFDGKIDISGGLVQSQVLSINTTGGAGMNISGNGTFITGSSQLGNVQYWVANNNIKANNGAPGWYINIDTTTDPSKIILTAVPEPSAIAVAAIGVAALAVRRLRRR